MDHPLSARDGIASAAAEFHTPRDAAHFHRCRRKPVVGAHVFYVIALHRLLRVRHLTPVRAKSHGRTERSSSPSSPSCCRRCLRSSSAATASAAARRRSSSDSRSARRRFASSAFTRSRFAALRAFFRVSRACSTSLPARSLLSDELSPALELPPSPGARPRHW